MFVAHENVSRVNKKKFQKPNILRRKVKIPPTKLLKTAATCESPEVISPVVNVNTLNICDLQVDKTGKRKNCKSIQNVIKLPISKISETSSDEIHISSIEVMDIDVHNKDCQGVQNSTLSSEQENDDENSLNVESFLVGSTVGENITLFENDSFQSRSASVGEGKQKWCLDFIDDSHKIILECDNSQAEGVYLEEKSDHITSVSMCTTSSAHHEESYVVPVEEVSEDSNVPVLSVDQFFTETLNYKCDVPDCSKEFASEHKLKRHKSVHNKDGTTRIPRQTTAECPVKKILEDGVEEPCGKIFNVREDLLKHLNEDHKPEDAIYRCEECGRRFFWASGLSAHGRAHRARRPRALACGWPGCGRVFRQPCRLREHTRAHTGDKPYPCRYPNCGWSFRTASKLVRHARRHTGERRHACGACGRAFHRREHLRDHAARHHSARPRLVCTHPGCEQSFTNMSSLYLHMKKIHRTDEDPASTNGNSLKDSQPTSQTDPDDLFMVTFMSKSDGLDDGSVVEVDPTSVHYQQLLQIDGTGGQIECIIDSNEPASEIVGEDVYAEGDELLAEEGHSARTHCTWPLPSRNHHYEQPDAYVLEEDCHVESSEISENNIYTVRSDLFLHGNVLTNEDSEHMAGEACDGALDAELLPPSVDIAQEELYSDAVDESSFRVFLLSGEDLT